MLTSLSLIFLLGLLLGRAFKRLKLPSLLGMIITGMILGPFGLDRIAPSILGISSDLRQLALIIILNPGRTVAGCRRSEKSRPPGCPDVLCAGQL